MAVAIHAGHTLRDEVADLTALSAARRLREEDPGTAGAAPADPAGHPDVNVGTGSICG